MENNLSLYQINQAIEQLGQDLYDVCDKETGVIENVDLYQNLLAKYESLQMAKEDKIKGCIYLTHKFEDNVKLIDKEIERLKGLKEKAKKADIGIRKLLSDVLEPNKKLDLGTVGIGWRKSYGLIIDNEEEKKQDLTDKLIIFTKKCYDEHTNEFLEIFGNLAPYVKTKIEVDFNKTALKEDIANGATIDGVEIEERTNLQIK